MNRVVTGWDDEGNPAVLFEGPPPTVMDFGSIVTTELWVTDTAPPSVKSREDTTTRTWDIQPPNLGCAFRIVTFAPDADAGAPAVEAEGPEFLGAHVTDTLDFVAVISGEITLVLGDREITLHPGDSVIQQATPHDWRNRGTEPCVMVGVLLSTHS